MTPRMRKIATLRGSNYLIVKVSTISPAAKKFVTCVSNISHFSHLSTFDYHKNLTSSKLVLCRLPIDRRMGEMSIRVLVVDDDEDMRATLMGFISRLGVKVSTAGSIADAEHALHGQNPPFDLMMTDLSIRFHNYGDVIFRTRKNADGARTVRVQTRPGLAGFCVVSSGARSQTRLLGCESQCSAQTRLTPGSGRNK
jgi:CheY-like chemotaxis protein